MLMSNPVADYAFYKKDRERYLRIEERMRKHRDELFAAHMGEYNGAARMYWEELDAYKTRLERRLAEHRTEQYSSALYKEIEDELVFVSAHMSTGNYITTAEQEVYRSRRDAKKNSFIEPVLNWQSFDDPVK